LPLQRLPPSRRNLLTGLAAFSALGAGTYAEAKNTAGMGYVILLGDSVFDNAAYVGGGPDVIAQLREQLPAGWRATLSAPISQSHRPFSAGRVEDRRRYRFFIGEARFCPGHFGGVYALSARLRALTL
jgi:hypothetical protein